MIFLRGQTIFEDASPRWSSFLWGGVSPITFRSFFLSLLHERVPLRFCIRYFVEEVGLDVMAMNKGAGKSGRKTAVDYALDAGNNLGEGTKDRKAQVLAYLKENGEAKGALLSCPCLCACVCSCAFQRRYVTILGGSSVGGEGICVVDPSQAKSKRCRREENGCKAARLIIATAWCCSSYGICSSSPCFRRSRVMTILVQHHVLFPVYR